MQFAFSSLWAALALLLAAVAARWVPTRGIAQFGDVTLRLRTEVDQLAKK